MAENQSVWHMKIKVAHYYMEKAYREKMKRREKDHTGGGRGTGKMDRKEEE